MNCYPVSEMVNIPGANDPSMLNFTGERLHPETVPVRLSSGYRTHKEKHPANAPTIEERRSASGPKTPYTYTTHHCFIPSFLNSFISEKFSLLQF
jgi:hypothetical protein